jgi:hypothetical protein
MKKALAWMMQSGQPVNLFDPGRFPEVVAGFIDEG